MMRFGDAATFHQPSLRNIAAQADAKWAFIARDTRRARGTRELAAESGRSLRDEVKKKNSINRIENTRGLRRNLEHNQKRQPRPSELGRTTILSPSRETRCLLVIGLIAIAFAPRSKGEGDFSTALQISAKINY